MSKIITLSGHSGGGRRNYINLLNAKKNQFLDKNGNSILDVRFYGTPANNNDIKKAAARSGANLIIAFNNKIAIISKIFFRKNISKNEWNIPIFHEAFWLFLQKR